MRHATAFALGLLLSTGIACAADDSRGWPMMGGDAARSGYTPEPISSELAESWTHRAAHPPAPAWPREDRMQFDRAFHPVVAGGRLVYGSSADGTVRALDVATGETRWVFFTEGPIRCAPAVWRDRLFVGSDDGSLYALGLEDGELLGKWRGGPADDRVLGNERIVSRWPVRGGPVVLDDVVYFGAGIWQSEGVVLKALDAATGRELWSNDEAAGIDMPQPHGGANAASGVSAQGHLAAAGERLFVPTGRAVPAAFLRTTGEFDHYVLQANHGVGGTECVVGGDFLYNGGAALRTETGEQATMIGAGRFAAVPGGVLRGTPRSISFLRAVEEDGVDRLGKPIRIVKHVAEWTASNVAADRGLIVAGRTIVAGGDGVVTLVDSESRETLWKQEVEGAALGLAAAEGRLYVSTDRGVIHCFGGPEPKVTRSARPMERWARRPGGDAPLAEEIVRQSGRTAGYCVDLGCGDGSLAHELALRTKLHVVAIDADADNVAAARRRLSAAGLYGPRVTVLLADPLKSHLPGMFADLVVSANSADADATELSRELLAEAHRLRRPYGGISCLGKAGALRIEERGAPPNAGQWTHQYADAANTVCSTDAVGGELKVRWYADVDLELAQRHGRAPAPLFYEGRIFQIGMHALRAIDAYTGRTLWEFEQRDILKGYDADHLIGTAATGSNLCVAPEGVFLRNGATCYRLDHATGKERARYETPDGAPWGYVACVDGVLFGSSANPEHVVRHAYRPGNMKDLLSESSRLFAIDLETGRRLWQYRAVDSIRHNTIAIGGGRVFLIDRPAAAVDLLGDDPYKPAPAQDQPFGALVCLDPRTGKERWKVEEEVFGTVLSYSEAHDVLVMSYQPTNWTMRSERGGRLAGYRGTTGKHLWDRRGVRYQSRVLINDDTIYALGGAWDLLSGEPRPFSLAKSYGCGQLSGSRNLMLFRSATLSWAEYTAKPEIRNFGGVRPGCWINAIPAGGLVLVPDASSGCRCSYQNRSWLALSPEE
ncbi:MAG: PQQ-binding-like beta-propeller repeat protein [Planctomycetaceae bacterium]